MNKLLRHRQQFPLFLFVVALAALSCLWIPQISGAAEPAVDAAHGGGNGGGHGHGGGGNGGGGGKPGGDLTAALQPDVWNTNYSHSDGTVSAVIRGSGLGDVHLDSIVLIGTDDAEDPVEPLRATRQGNQIRAFFAKDDVIDSLDTPKAGEVHEVTIEFTTGTDNTKVDLTDNVRIVGPDDGDGGDDDGESDLDLAIQPDSWNTNWAHNHHGTVSALIRGDGLADVDLDSIELVGTDADADPVPALRASRTGNHIRAFFAMDDAYGTLDTPKRGEVHEITIRFTAAGDDKELTDRIRVVGPGH